MSAEPTATQVFLSTVSDDFEKPGAPFPGLRSRLRFYLNRAQGQKAVAQEEFRQVQVPTLQKLDNLIPKQGNSTKAADLRRNNRGSCLARITVRRMMKY
jgi:hypothetical protein